MSISSLFLPCFLLAAAGNTQTLSQLHTFWHTLCVHSRTVRLVSQWHDVMRDLVFPWQARKCRSVGKWQSWCPCCMTPSAPSLQGEEIGIAVAALHIMSQLQGGFLNGGFGRTKDQLCVNLKISRMHYLNTPSKQLQSIAKIKARRGVWELMVLVDLMYCRWGPHMSGL
jgi:hypothetical protein